MATATDDTKKFQTYQPRPYPTIKGGDQRYIQQELANISTSITSTLAVLQALQARLVAGGL